MGDHKGGHRIFKIAFATFAVIGLIGSLLLFFGANMIANLWLQIPEAEMLDYWEEDSESVIYDNWDRIKDWLKKILKKIVF